MLNFPNLQEYKRHKMPTKQKKIKALLFALYYNKMKETAISPSKKSCTPPPPRRRRTRSSSTISTSTSSSSSSIISTPSPLRNYPFTPFHPSSSSSSVPFSWERQPGIPKIPPKPQKTLSLTLNLPLPPPSRSKTFPQRKRRSDQKFAVDAEEFDPFAAAIAECAKDSPAEPDFWRSRPAVGVADRKRWSIADRLGFLDLYGSCKTCHVEENSYRVLNRRG